MFNNKNSIEYSLALFSIAKDENKVKNYLDNAKVILELFMNSKLLLFIDIMDSYKLTVKEKDKIINDTFKKMEKQFINFLKLLASKNKFKLIKDILNIFIKYCYENLNIKEGIIYSSSLLKPSIIKAIEKKFSKDKNCKVSFKNLLDKELISGIKIVIENDIIENSIMSDLEQITKTLKGTR